MLKIYNSLTQQKEIFKPLEDGKVKMYVCGMTVYDYNHIGHARSLVVFDVIVRYLRAYGYDVTYVRNITDVDDKIIKRAQENQESCESLTARFIDAMHEDDAALHIQLPDHEPRATQFIPQIISLIQTLLDKKYAYVGDNGDVYYSIRHFSEYGKLSHRDIDKLRTGVRIEISENKRDPLDFVLWKLAKPGEPKWMSPWGEGRPGWHTECSAMSSHLLGQPFDIHGGGMDLKFPHHENEIAQSEAANDTAFATLWMHAGLLQIDKEKMSKSLGNIISIRDALKQYHPEVLRYFLLSSHYRSPVSYSSDNLQKIQNSLERLYVAIRGLPEVDQPPLGEFDKRFQEVMEDDFNTPEAFAVFFELAHEINRWREQNQIEKAASLAVTLKCLAKVFGLLCEDPEAYLKGVESVNDVQQIEMLIQARNQARASKHWSEADRIRDQLTQRGILLEDTAEGTTWRR